MAEWLGDTGPDGPPREIVARRREGLVVKAVRATAACGAEIDLSGGYRLTLFPAGSTGEDWRLLNPTDEDAPHFVVVGGGRVEEDG
jgi:hypothetical protein